MSIVKSRSIYIKAPAVIIKSNFFLPFTSLFFLITFIVLLSLTLTVVNLIYADILSYNFSSLYRCICMFC